MIAVQLLYDRKSLDWPELFIYVVLSATARVVAGGDYSASVFYPL